MISSFLGFKPKQRVGLLGGSFDPPHDGHVLVTLQALKRLALDEVWWLVSPQNPLKNRQSAPLAERMSQARAILPHPRVKMTDIELHLGSSLTCDTVAGLKGAFPSVSFVWIMGGDNLAQFHRWKNWSDIARNIPIAVFARPGHRAQVHSSPASRWLRRFKLDESDAEVLVSAQAPAWTFITMPLSTTSSSKLREKQRSAYG